MGNHKRSRKQKQPVADLRRDEGFALIITITLLTFLVLVLFAMTSLTRVETRMAGGSQQINVARENAVLALHAAVAQLQRYAGPDERVTARADISPANDENPYWTGVWEDAGLGSPTLMTWLVSGNEDGSFPDHFTPVPDLDRTMESPYESPNSPLGVFKPSSWPASASNPSFVRLVGPGSTGDNQGAAGNPDGRDPIHPMPNTSAYRVPGGVVAPKVPIFSREFPGLPTSPSAEHVVGHYAFWVGDQGVKASAALSEKHLDVDAYATEANEDEMIRRLRQMIPQRMWFEGDKTNNWQHTILNEYPQFDLLSDLNLRDENERLADVIDYWQVRNAFPNRADFAEDINGRNQLRDRFHDITSRTYGVLASTEGAGLKLDMSAGAGATGHQDFLNIPNSVLGAVNPSLGTATVDLVAPTTLTVGSPALVIAPIVTELVGRYAVWQDEVSGEMQLQFEAEVELWNPYTVDLNLGSDTLILRLENLPQLDVTHSYDDFAPRTVDIASLGAHYIDLDSSIIGSTTIEAGEIVHVTYTTQVDLEDTTGDLIAPPLTHSTNPAIPNTVEVSAGVANIEVEVWLFTGGFPGGDVDVEIGNLTTEAVGHFILDQFDNFSVGPYPGDDATPKFGYNFRMRDEVDDPAWLTFYDPRMIGLENGGSVDAIEIESNPLQAFLLTLDDPSMPQHLMSNTGATRIRLFELPIQEQVNIGALQHLYYHGEPAYALGNDWAGPNVNLDFDRYFLSGIPQAGAWPGSWDFPVPNTRLVPYLSIDQFGNQQPSSATDFQDPESAQYLLTEGAFNINSTSVNAWRSVIGAMSIRRDGGGDNFDPDTTTSGEWIYAASPSGIPLSSAIFRFPQTGHLLNTAYQVRNGLEANPSLAYMQGVRELTEEQVYALAYEIVYLLRNPPMGVQTPFLSLNDFVDSGIIQMAIENCDFGTLSPGNPIAAGLANINGTVPAYSAAFITQADIITTMAPFMAARSDTFIIRAYGDSYNPATDETIARAYCEAIVQRVPATLDPTDDPVSPNQPFGRRFEIVYFRWLSPDQL